MKLICLQIFFSFLFFLTIFGNAKAEHAELRDCAGDEAVGEKCKVPLSVIHPTQFSVGMFEVTKKMRQLKKLDDEELKTYIKEHPAPVVLGPGNVYFITDHHHLGLALMKLGKGKIAVQIGKDARNLNESQFWNLMLKKNWVFLYDENGNGPLKPSQLPADLLALKDDPYRSLAGIVRENGGYEKTSAPYAEFQWAGFFRERMHLNNDKDGFEKALPIALEWAHSSEAKNLPGYISP